MNPFRQLFTTVTRSNHAVGIIDAGTERITWAHGVPRMPKLDEDANRHHVAADFLAFAGATEIGSTMEPFRPAGPEWDAWLVVCDALESPDVELTVEEFAPFSALFNILVARGVPFDDAFVARVRELQAVMVNTDDDSDQDGTDGSLCDGEWSTTEEGRKLLAS